MTDHSNFTNPRYPVYIISKNRADSMLTSRSLTRMRVPHFIAIEPHNIQAYEEALVNFGLKKYVTLLILPFENHGDGPGRARNWCWDHSITIGAEKHWVLDDNIIDFYRLNRNGRYRVESGAIFRAAEDFIDRFENVPVSGFNYKFFVPKGSKRPAFVKNTRIYSCLLISNDCKFKWRGRYNEDTDLSLRVLKDGDCTIQFNCFLQDKAVTQSVKGGNSEEFYFKENVFDKTIKEDIKDTLGQKYVEYKNPGGTINKSQMLVNMHPDVARIVWRYGRVHHFVDYTKFKKNKLRYKSDIVIPSGINEYNMKLVHFKNEDELDSFIKNKPDLIDLEKDK